VLKKPQPTVVQIGTVQDIAKAVPANFAQRRPSRWASRLRGGNGSGNGHSKGNGTHAIEKATEAVAGD